MQKKTNDYFFIYLKNHLPLCCHLPFARRIPHTIGQPGPLPFSRQPVSLRISYNLSLHLLLPKTLYALLFLTPSSFSRSLPLI